MDCRHETRDVALGVGRGAGQHPLGRGCRWDPDTPGEGVTESWKELEQSVRVFAASPVCEDVERSEEHFWEAGGKGAGR